MNSYLPKELQKIALQFISHNFEIYLVGGCVRDIFLGKTPSDFDMSTNATPEEILKIFPESKYENMFGTVLIKTNSDDPLLKIVQVTTFRTEGKYSDYRRPDEIEFAKTIEEDLSRRDFTINAMALHILKENISLSFAEMPLIDPFGGLYDIEKKIIRTVHDPNIRFSEDALRLLRAVRFSISLEFVIQEKTFSSVCSNASLISKIANERIRDEFEKIILSSNAAEGIVLLEKTGLLKFIIPELCEGVGINQNKHHIFTVFEHSVKALEYAAKKEYSLSVRLASLFHDIAKPRTKRGEGDSATFYNHEVVGAKVTGIILTRLCFPKHLIERVVHLVRNHMFYYNIGDVSERGVRRFLSRVGTEYIDDLLKIREADRIGSGVPKAVPYKTRHLLFMLEKVKHDPVHPKMLALKGNELMKLLHISPGPRVGAILAILLEDILDDPTRNTYEYLSKKAEILNTFSEQELKDASSRAKEKSKEVEDDIEGEMKKKFFVT